MPLFEVVFPKGINFRLSPCFGDKATGVKPAKAGEILEGNLVEGGWLELSTDEGLFIPLRGPEGTELLRAIAENKETGKGRFIPWQDDSGQGDTDQFATPQVGSKAARSNELLGLDKKFDQKCNRQRSSRVPFGSAATSHNLTTSYMNEFRDVLQEMGTDTRDDSYIQRYASPASPAQAGTVVRGRSGNRPTSGAGVGTPGTASEPNSRSQSRTQFSGARNATPDIASTKPLARCGAMMVSGSSDASSDVNWLDGPRFQPDQLQTKAWTSVKHGRERTNRCMSGRVVDVSDRNILCMAISGEKAVLGSADHGVKELDIRSGRQCRNLYSKRCGHSEWVSSVAYVPDGRIISGAQDSKLCVWNATGVNCVDLNGHVGSISRVRVDGQGKLAISSSYDKSLCVWNLRSNRSVACCTGHNAPVMDFVWIENIVASGDRNGVVKLWDSDHAQCNGTLKGHSGHITAMLAIDEGAPSIITGAQDGQVRVWDLRLKRNAASQQCHTGGAVNDIGVTTRTHGALIVSTGADGKIAILEPRANYKPLHELPNMTDDFLYSLLVLESVAFVGDGRGKVTCIDLQAGQVSYGLDAGDNAIRCLGTTSASLVCAGDDGNVVIFDF